FGGGEFGDVLLQGVGLARLLCGGAPRGATAAVLGPRRGEAGEEPDSAGDRGVPQPRRAPGSGNLVRRSTVAYRQRRQAGIGALGGAPGRGSIGLGAFGGMCIGRTGVEQDRPAWT